MLINVTCYIDIILAGKTHFVYIADKMFSESLSFEFVTKLLFVTL